MIIIDTLINDPTFNHVVGKSVFQSINEPSSINLVEQVLIENEDEYLEGAIELIYNSKAILSKDMETTDLLFTWQTMIEPLLIPEDKEHRIVLLDSSFGINLTKEESGYIIRVLETHEEVESVYVVPDKEYEIAVREGFLKFGDYLYKNNFNFSEESSYLSFQDDYKRLKAQLKF